VLLIVFVEAIVLFGPLAFLATHVHLTYGVSLSTSGSIATFYAVGGMTFALGSRRLVSRFGEAGLARMGGALLALGLAAVALSPVWWSAPLACAIAGLGFYMLHNTLQTNATQMAPQARGAAVSLFAACFFLGQTVGVAAVSLLIESIGSRAVIVAGGVAVGLVGAWFGAQLTMTRAARG
jgi:predicted MFS family arabinose efflux permease